MVAFQKKIKLWFYFSVGHAAFNILKTVLQVPCHLSRRSFLEVCSGVAGGSDGVWIQPLWETGSISSSCWCGRFSSLSDTNTTALKHSMSESLSLLFFSFGNNQEIINKSSKKKGDLQELPYEVIRFFIYLFVIIFDNSIWVLLWQ